MPFERPTLTDLVARIKSDIETRVTGGETLLRRGVLSILSRVFAGSAHLLYGYIGFQAEQLFAVTADVEGLESIADEYGINRDAGTQATGDVIATGTNGTLIPKNTVLQTVDGESYIVDANATIALGVATLALTAVDVGSNANQDAGTLLDFTSPIALVDSQVTVDTGGITGGIDEQTDESLRAEVLRRKQYPPYGGCEYDYETWMLEYADVTRVWVFDQYNGLGTVGCAFVQDNSTPYIPTTATMALMKAYISEHDDPATGRTVGMPLGGVSGLYMIPLVELLIDFSLSIYPNTSSVQTDIQAELGDLILREGGPGETIYISDVQVALAGVDDLQYFTVNTPGSDSAALSTQIHALGTIIYSDY